ncbi:Hypothetical predicted protein [Cloeon dipterum]|uniref:Uncharacterized protein n=1 Tax=Cloeon dipterum TaxID=197152 RepID=A0A8S1DTB3_9INSE|nr:Hypothetical predicted protein [Cloeon dipterum]
MIDCCDLDGDIAIYMARTFLESYYVPGYTFNDVGYFVSKELEPFQTSIFQVPVQIFAEIEFEDFSELEDGMVADDVVDESEQIKFGTFEIGGVRYCGMVDSQHTCHINFFGRVISKSVPHFEVIVTSYHEDQDD